VTLSDNAVGTTYCGTTFRSPLAARWAVFFDKMGIAWTYQHEGLVFDGEWVLPDFWLPDYGCFWEVRASQTFDEERFGAWAAIMHTPVIVSTRLPHYCSDLTPARLIVVGFPCAEPMPWPGPDPQQPTSALRQRIGEVTGHTWVFHENRLPGECLNCERPVLFNFDAGTTRATCPVCQWTGIPARLLARFGVAGDAAEAAAF
jgi:hypothetical protein